MAVTIPTTARSTVTIGTKNPKVTITCTSSNRNWTIQYPIKYRQTTNLTKVMKPILQKFPFLSKHSELTSPTSKITHNRECLEPLANMMLHGSRDGKDDGRNQYTHHKRTNVWQYHEVQDLTKISFIGDSWTDSNCYYGYCKILEKKFNVLGCTVYQAGLGGTNSEEIKQQFISELNTHNSDMFIMTDGGNDVWSIKNVNTTFNNIKYIIDQCISKNKKLIIVSYAMVTDIWKTLPEDYPLLDYVLDLSTSIDNYVTTKNNSNITYINLYNESSLDYTVHPEKYITNDAHLLIYGNKIIAQRVLPKALEYINLRSVLNTGSDYQPVWTIDEIYNKEHVPSFIERTWDQMI